MATASAPAAYPPRQRSPRPRINRPLLAAAARVWLAETLLAARNSFVLMEHVYRPRWGGLVAYQIGMATRIAVIFLLADVLFRAATAHTARDLVAVGVLWLDLEEIFEWGVSLALGRSVREILVGRHIGRGSLWPFVLLSYVGAPLVVGVVRHPGKVRAAP
jgi:hypothetical protein